MPYKEYARYVGKQDRSDAVHPHDLVERKRRAANKKGWQIANANLAADAFKDDVIVNDGGHYRSRSMPEIYGGYWQYD